MHKRILWILRCLALGHFGWGILLLLAAASSVMGIVRIISHMPTGTIWTYLIGAGYLAAMNVLPEAALGVWMVKLGLRLWTAEYAQLRTAVFWTHGVLFILGSLAVVLGIHSIAAAQRSTAHGGGLLSPVAFIPFLFGVPAVALAFCSLAVALTAIPKLPKG